MTGEQISYASRLRLPVCNLNGRRLNADSAVGNLLQTYAGTCGWHRQRKACRADGRDAIAFRSFAGRAWLCGVAQQIPRRLFSSIGERIVETVTERRSAVQSN